MARVDLVNDLVLAGARQQASRVWQDQASDLIVSKHPDCILTMHAQDHTVISRQF